MFLDRVHGTVVPLVCGIAACIACVSAHAQEIVITEADVAEKPVYSPYAGRAYADNVFFGDIFDVRSVCMC